MVGCDSGDEDSGGDAFVGGSDVLDGLYVGSMNMNGSVGLTMRVDQNQLLVYGPITIGAMSGNFDGSYSGATIQFSADVANGGTTGTFNFTGQITNGGKKFSGSYNGVVNGAAVSGNWSVSR